MFTVNLNIIVVGSGRNPCDAPFHLRINWYKTTKPLHKTENVGTFSVGVYCSSCLANDLGYVNGNVEQ